MSNSPLDGCCCIRSSSQRPGHLNHFNPSEKTSPKKSVAVDEGTLAARQTQLRDEAAHVVSTLATCGDVGPEEVRTVLGVFEFAQNAAQIWRGSKMDRKREILEAVSLNRTLGDVTLVVEKRKPFDGAPSGSAKRLEIQLSRDDRI